MVLSLILVIQDFFSSLSIEWIRIQRRDCFSSGVFLRKIELHLWYKWRKGDVGHPIPYKNCSIEELPVLFFHHTKTVPELPVLFHRVLLHRTELHHTRTVSQKNFLFCSTEQNFTIQELFHQVFHHIT
ncbi:hypothetical protein CDAR_464391 [Caerostris darwini]|uniref:Maturase K n=1 Tax=Caerostris darwini TaxID=1538125 RepID=A0AAV4VUY1_9ARAC|nr:hypothetical protein CDAR_464391 [Caerostris darwini]